jgi:hypothetical protein
LWGRRGGTEGAWPSGDGRLLRGGPAFVLSRLGRELLSGVPAMPPDGHAPSVPPWATPWSAAANWRGLKWGDRVDSLALHGRV